MKLFMVIKHGWSEPEDAEAFFPNQEQADMRREVLRMIGIRCSVEEVELYTDYEMDVGVYEQTAHIHDMYRQNKH